MFSSERHVGRLVELRVESPFTEDEMGQLVQTHLEVLRSTESPYIIAVDMRRAHVFPAPITERFITLMGVVNPDLRRSGVLVNGSAVLGLQAERAIAEAGNANRRAFRDPDELIHWLAEVLSEEEVARTREFFRQSEERDED